MDEVLEMAMPTSPTAQGPAAAPVPVPTAQHATPAMLLQMAVQQGADIAKLKELMDLQERWQANEARLAFREDFAAFRGENIIIPKTKHVDRGRGGSFDQAEYDEVCRRLSPALSHHGFGFRHDQKFGLRRIMEAGVENDIGWVWVTCYLEHRKGHTESLELEGPPGDLSVNTPTQNMQTTASFLKRQALLAITGTATGGEDDESKLREPSKEHQDDTGTEALIKAGREAAKKGMKPLNEWWGSLTAPERKALNSEFTGMRREARAIDGGRDA